MNNDLVSRRWLLNEYDKRHDGPPGGARKLIEEAPPVADVRPVRLINAGIETALQILDGINEEGWLPHPVYSELHDAISVIGEYAQNGADMREVKTDV